METLQGSSVLGIEEGEAVSSPGPRSPIGGIPPEVSKKLTAKDFL
jgi:hypothetical protein